MRFNPLLDVLVEVSGMFSASVEVRVLQHRRGGVFFEREFRDEFLDADAAIETAVREGHQVIEARLDSLEEEVRSKLTEAV